MVFTTKTSSTEFLLSQEGAFAFLSKSFVEVQRSAESDLKFVAARAKNLSDLANNNLDEWHNAKFIRLGGEELSAGKIIKKLKEGGEHALKGRLSVENQVYSGTSDQKSKQRFLFGPKLNNPRNSRKEIDWFNLQHWQTPNFDLNKGNKSEKQFLPTTFDWEPLKKVKQGLKEIESKAAGSKNPAEFLQKVSQSLVLPFTQTPLMTPKASKKKDVPPLDVPELLGNLMRQSEPFLDQIGMNKDVYRKLCHSLQKMKYGKDDRKNLPSTGASTDDDLSNTDTYLETDFKSNLDSRIASVIQSTGYRYNGGTTSGKPFARKDGKRNIAIFTTASLPWMTGTAVNPLLRAAYLAKTGKQNVTLLVPWLSKGDQEKVYPNHITFDSPAEQEQYVRDWLQARIGFAPDFKISFYPGLFSVEKRSIFSVGDISSFVPDREADVAVLEEPEHLTWYYHGRRWTDKFSEVVGIVHTNYLEYVRREKNGAMQAFMLEHVNKWLVRCYCHKVVRLSAATQDFTRSIVCNVHGVGVKFLEIGSKMADAQKTGKSPFNKGAYYLGKMVWSKGYRELVDLLAIHKEELRALKVDVYGNGEDSDAVQSEAVQKGLRIKFNKGRDHADTALQSYKVFINPSESDVVCTTTAEALAMGKIVVCADHPSNEFFKDFPNCLTYKTKDEFVVRVKEAMAMEPAPLSDEHRHMLSWEAATDRFLDCAGLDAEGGNDLAEQPLYEIKSPQDLKKGRSLLKTLSLSMSVPDLDDVVDKSLFYAHHVLSGIETARVASGAPPKSMKPDLEMSQELGLPPPKSDKIVYGW